MQNLPPHVLVIRRRYLGDIVLLGPLFRNLRLHWPQARLAALVEPAYGDVLAINPDVDETLVLPGARDGAGRWFGFLRSLRRGRFTHVLDMDNVERTALLTRWTGAPFRVALLCEPPPRLSWLYTRLVIDSAAEHERRAISEYYLQVLPPAGVPVVSRDLRLVPRAADVTFVRDLLRSKTGDDRPGFLLIHPGSRSPCRIWPAARFAAVCDRVQDELGARVVLVAGPGEQAVVRAIQCAARCPPVALDQPLSVPQFAALTTQSGVMLCHDSGPMHVAAAVGVPVIALFSSQSVALWGPAGENHTVLQPPLPCLQCVAPDQCVPADSGRNYCVRNITADRVFAAVRARLGRVVPAP